MQSVQGFVFNLTSINSYLTANYLKQEWNTYPNIYFTPQYTDNIYIFLYSTICLHKNININKYQKNYLNTKYTVLNIGNTL